MYTRFYDFIQFAIELENDAAELYEKYSDIVTSPGTKAILKSMALMERGHEAKLKLLQETGESLLKNAEVVNDLHISDYLLEPILREDSDIQSVFIFAMKAEQKAYELYSKLATLETDYDTQQLFIALASEEKKHKFDLEKEYEKGLMNEN